LPASSMACTYAADFLTEESAKIVKLEVRSHVTVDWTRDAMFAGQTRLTAATCAGQLLSDQACAFHAVVDVGACHPVARFSQRQLCWHLAYGHLPSPVNRGRS
jgi:hypothetical protein